MASKALQQERRRLAAQEEFPCKTTRQLNDKVVFEYMPSARSEGAWSRQGSWMAKFAVFARGICKESGIARTLNKCAASNTMCRHFIASVAKEGGGVTRPRSARAALSKYRQQRGLVSLTGDEAIAAIVRGSESQQPATKKQAAGFTDTMVRLVVRRWGSSKSWWQRQIATIMSLGFVSIMRLGEMCKLRRAGIRVVYHDGSECALQDLVILPTPSRVKGLLLHVPWRKNHVSQDCWVPVACKVTIRLIIAQARSLRNAKCNSNSFFPSREFVAGKGQRMHKRNWLGEQSWVTAMRKALRECVPHMTHPWSTLYSGHSMRVGGSNHMRKTGVADDVHRRLGGWMCLASAQGYMALSPDEQFRYTLRLAKAGNRRSAFTKQTARRAFATITRMH